MTTMRNGFRRFKDSTLDLAGAALILLFLASGGVNVWQGFQHNQDLGQIKTLTAQSDAQSKRTEKLANVYLAEQHALARGGKETAAFALWLVQAQSAICSAVHADCPAVPSFNGVNAGK